LTQGHYPFGFFTTGLAQGEAISFHVSNDTWLQQITGRVDNTADCSLRLQLLPLLIIRIHATQALVFMWPFQTIEVPPGDAINCGDYGSARRQQGIYLRHNFRHRVGLEGDDDEVLRRQ
jgi:hypothetical protein